MLHRTILVAALALAGCRDSVSRTNLTQAEGHDSKPLTSPPPAETGKLQGKRIAILATDGFEQIELVKTQKMLADEGAKTVVVAPKREPIQGFNHRDPGEKVTVDMTIVEADPNAFDALVLPGGVVNPDMLRQDARAVRFVRTFAEAKKPIAAICHGPWMLIEAGVVRDRTVTSWPSLKTDLLNAGAVWVDRAVVADHGLVTSRMPDDIDAFVKKTVEEIREPQHAPGRQVDQP